MDDHISPRRTFWVDVEDLFQHFVANPRPSGIQRLVFELLKVLPECARLTAEAPAIIFVRHTHDESLLREVPFSDVARLFETGAPPVPEPSPPADEPAVAETVPAEAVSAETVPEEPAPQAPHVPLQRRTRSYLIRQIQKLPPGLAEPVLRPAVLQIGAIRQARLLAWIIFPSLAPQAAATEVASPIEVAPAAEIPPAPEMGSIELSDFAESSDAAVNGHFPGEAGDIFLILGAPWVHPDYGALIHRLKAHYEIEPILLLYDLIPLRRPEWCHASLVKDFKVWLDSTLPQCSRLLAISEATAEDVEDYALEAGLSLSQRVAPVPIGTGFGLAVRDVTAADLNPRGLPLAGTYALFVSTLEARKNHALLFRVWRRLLSELPRDQVPTLVFAGRVGWLVSDLMQQLENTDWLGGKIRLIRDPTDAELMALYRGCQFTLFPSLFEGWGLPVSESLALGRPCIASNRTSLPEAGGNLARYFDPEDFDDACRAVREVIEDPAGLEVWRQRVAREFRHVPWESTADAILEFCLPAASAPYEVMLSKTGT